MSFCYGNTVSITQRCSMSANDLLVCTDNTICNKNKHFIQLYANKTSIFVLFGFQNNSVLCLQTRALVRGVVCADTPCDPGCYDTY